MCATASAVQEKLCAAVTQSTMISGMACLESSRRVESGKAGSSAAVLYTCIDAFRNIVVYKISLGFIKARLGIPIQVARAGNTTFNKLPASAQASLTGSMNITSAFPASIHLSLPEDLIMSAPVTRIATFRFKCSVTAEQKAHRASAFLALYAEHPELVRAKPRGGRPLETPLNLTGVKREKEWDLGFVVVFKDEEARQKFDADPGHETLKNETDPLLERVFVYDFVDEENLGWKSSASP